VAVAVGDREVVLAGGTGQVVRSAGSRGSGNGQPARHIPGNLQQPSAIEEAGRAALQGEGGWPRQQVWEHSAVCKRMRVQAGQLWHACRAVRRSCRLVRASRAHTCRRTYMQARMRARVALRSAALAPCSLCADDKIPMSASVQRTHTPQARALGDQGHPHAAAFWVLRTLALTEASPYTPRTQVQGAGHQEAGSRSRGGAGAHRPVRPVSFWGLARVSVQRGGQVHTSLKAGLLGLDGKRGPSRECRCPTSCTLGDRPLTLTFLTHSAGTPLTAARPM